MNFFLFGAVLLYRKEIKELKYEVIKDRLENTKGNLFIMGGGKRPDYLMQKFLELAGDRNAKIIIVPAASMVPGEAALSFISQFSSLGYNNVHSLDCTHKNIDTAGNLDLLEGASGVFFTGGDQNKLTHMLEGTEVLDAVRAVYLNGGIIGGTSAGAAIMTRVMITSFAKIENLLPLPDVYPPPAESYALSTGFGFLRNAVVDQHFGQRNRHSRLISAVFSHPKLTGIGIDESTAALVRSDNSLSVEGEGFVTVYSISPIDGSRVVVSDGTIQKRVLVPGEVFSLVPAHYAGLDSSEAVNN